MIDIDYTHHERHPKYPVYSLPFKADSVYRESFVNNLEENQKKANDWNNKIIAPSLDPKEIKLKVSADHLMPHIKKCKLDGKEKMIDTRELMNSELYKTSS